MCIQIQLFMSYYTMYIHAAANHDGRAEAGQAHGEGRHDPH